MTLLNGLLAFGAAAFTIPLIIHLLHRSRYRTIEWGAMHLLRSSNNVNSRRMQWQHLLLLLLRCALPILLAMAMARPLLQSFLSADGLSPISVAIVLDDSMSMFAAERGDDQVRQPTRFSVACQSAAEILRELPSGSNSIVFLGGSAPEALAGQVPDELASKLSSKALASGAKSAAGQSPDELAMRSVPSSEFVLDDSIRASLQWLANSPHPRRQLVLISDFQKHEWSEITESKLSEIAQQLASQTVRPELSIVRIGQTTESKKSKEMSQHSNLSVDSIEVSPSLLAVEREAVISTTLGNNGPIRCDSVMVAVFVNDIEIERQEVSIAPLSTTQIRTRWSPKQIGDHEIRVDILFDDDLRADNSLTTVVIVQEPIPILLVDGDRRNEAMQSETDFLRLALSPFSLLSGEKGDVFLSKTIQPHELNEAILKNYRTVCLCNVSEVNDAQQKWLRDYVSQGNGLIVFLGDKVRTEQYQSWPTQANNGLRIASFEKRTKVQSSSSDSSDRKSSATETVLVAGDRVKTQKIEFAPIRELSTVSLASLGSVRFEYRTPIALDPTALSNPSDASVAMRFEDDQAWILESKIDKGRCLWISSACDDDDSNLPTRSIYVPLIQKLAAFVCNANPPSTHLIAGELWTRETSMLTSKISKVAKEARITKPDGKIVSVELTEDKKLRFGETRLLGTYRAKLLASEQNLSAKDKELNQSMEEMLVCVKSQNRSSAKESKLAYLTSDDAANLAQTLGATVSTSSRDLLNLSHSDWHGREIWTWIWSALVICFLAEMALEQSLSPRRKSNPNQLAGQVVRGTVA